MKLRNHVFFEDLEKYGYQYKENIIYPTYQKKKTFGNKTIRIDILLMNRTIYINKSSKITNKEKKYLKDLQEANLLEKE